MRYLYQLLFAVMVIGLVAASADAQQQGGGGQGGGGQGGGGQGGGGQGGGGQGGGTQGGGGGGTALTQLEAAPSITAPGTTGGGASSAINTSNIFSTTYGNPLYQGTPTNAKSNAGPGGFGAVLYPTAAGNAAGGRGGAAGARGGIGGAASTANQFGTIISLPVQVSYPAVARFPAAPMTAAKLQTDLTGLIGRSTMIANPAGVQVLADGDTVTLRGTAKDADEARMIAGMVRMTPGVRGVVNELTFPQQ